MAEIRNVVETRYWFFCHGLNSPSCLFPSQLTLTKFITRTWINSFVLFNTQFGVTYSFPNQIDPVIEICQKKISLLGTVALTNLSERPRTSPALRTSLSSTATSYFGRWCLLIDLLFPFPFHLPLCY